MNVDRGLFFGDSAGMAGGEPMEDKQEQQQCKECGSSQFVKGMLAKTRMTSVSALTILFSSDVPAVFCRNCGLIQSMRVVNPERIR
jgi:uncharacterized Zn finger protein